MGFRRRVVRQNVYWATHDYGVITPKRQSFADGARHSQRPWLGYTRPLSEGGGSSKGMP